MVFSESEVLGDGEFGVSSESDEDFEDGTARYFAFAALTRPLHSPSKPPGRAFESMNALP